MKAWGVVSLLVLAGGAAGADRPNVLLFCIDDLKPALGCYGDPVAKSPNIDRLAQRGVRYERAYCNQAVCSPSRNALLVGLRPQTLGIYDLGTNFRLARPDAVSMPQYFRQNGYKTESLGKVYHVGHGNNDDEASWSAPPWKPDSPRYALPESRGAGGARARRNAARGNAAAGSNGAPYESADVPDSYYADGAVAEEAVRRLRAAAKEESTPFFLAVGFVKPHLPFVAPKRYWDLYDRDALPLAEVRTPPRGAPPYAPTGGGELRKYMGVPREGALDEELQRNLVHGYYAATSYADAQVGKVLDELDRLGLAANTIVVLWGDHGWHLGDHGMWCKHTNYEQAARIPLIVAAPGGAQGAASQAFVESVDVYPTLSELAGLAAPDALDGRSFASAVRDARAPARDHASHVYPRSGPNGQRLLGRAVRTDQYRLVEWKEFGAPAEKAEYELYDYVSDPLETENLAASRPEIVQQLRQLLARQAEPRPRLRAPAQAAPPRT